MIKKRGPRKYLTISYIECSFLRFFSFLSFMHDFVRSWYLAIKDIQTVSGSRRVIIIEKDDGSTSIWSDFLEMAYHRLDLD